MNKKYIIKESHVFDEIINSCPCVKSKYFIVFYRKKNSEIGKYGITSPKKLGNAVLRNKLRRQTRAILQEYQKNYSNEHDCIIIIRRSCICETYQVLSDNLQNLLLKVKEK